MDSLEQMNRETYLHQVLYSIVDFTVRLRSKSPLDFLTRYMQEDEGLHMTSRNNPTRFKRGTYKHCSSAHIQYDNLDIYGGHPLS